MRFLGSGITWGWCDLIPPVGLNGVCCLYLVLNPTWKRTGRWCVPSAGRHGAGWGQSEPRVPPNPSGSPWSHQHPLPAGAGSTCSVCSAAGTTGASAGAGLRVGTATAASQRGALLSLPARDDRPLPGGVLHHVQAGEARPTRHRCHPLLQVHSSEVERCGEPFPPVNKEISPQCLPPGLAVPGAAGGAGAGAHHYQSLS